VDIWFTILYNIKHLKLGRVKMHNHVIAGDFGYLPTYSDEQGYTHGSEALEGLKEYVNMVVDSVEDSGMFMRWHPEFEVVNSSKRSVEDYWLTTGVVTSIGTDGCKQTIQAVFNRELTSIDYAEITVCYEDCRVA
tara:strand:+ start:1097 stop:1501 length:405 start_codon:yes stop_codon:yes gene_type:complete